MQFTLQRMFYAVGLYCLALKAATLAPHCLDYPFLYSGIVFAIFAAVFYELKRLGIQG